MGERALRVPGVRHRMVAEVSAQAVLDDMNYPHSVLVGCETALVVFCAAFRGYQDAWWIAEAGLRATCVDNDRAKLDEMGAIYPKDWEWLCLDAYEGNPDRTWDVVSLDPWSNQFTRCADMIGTWCKLARHAVILGTGVDTIVRAPAGWVVSERRKRSAYDGGVFWTVLERA